MALVVLTTISVGLGLLSAGLLYASAPAQKLHTVPLPRRPAVLTAWGLLMLALIVLCQVVSLLVALISLLLVLMVSCTIFALAAGVLARFRSAFRSWQRGSAAP